MNILDIAIAKKLAGGGGGSGTDNYNDLSNLPKINDTTLSGNKSSSALGLQSEINSDSKLASDLVDDTNQDNKFVTSTEKNTWNGKQNAIDSDHKINADYVDDSTSTNKFVTASDKETWNAKQNAIDNSHKLSSDLVDDTNHTNKFVTSTEKQTWNAKQNAIDADHKLSSSLVSFTTAEAAALASGIDSSKVGQISTNQTNILLVQNATEELVDKGAKNQLTIPDIETLKALNIEAGVPTGTWSGNSFTYKGVTFTINYTDNTITTSGTSTTDHERIVINKFTFKSNNDYMISGCPSGGSYSGYSIAMLNYNNRDTGGGLEVEGDNATQYLVVYAQNSGTDMSGLTFKPMICTPDEWKISKNHEPFALPNPTLTSALVEQVDGGAKNKLDLSNATITVGSGLTLTRDGDAYVVNGTLSAQSQIVFTNFPPVAGDNLILSGCPSNGSTAGYGMWAYNGSTRVIIDAGSNIKTPYSGEITQIKFNFAAGNYSNIKFYPMICTKAAFDISSAFVPYRPDYDTLVNGGAAPFFTIPINHNMVYRGKNLGDTLTDAQHTALSSGNFTDLYLGDYWTKTVTIPAFYEVTTAEPANWSTNYTSYYTKSGDTYTPVSGDTAPTWAANTYYERQIPEQTVTLKAVIADFDTFYAGYASSYAGINTHHAAVIVTGFNNVVWNKTNTTAGGYVNSLIHKWLVNSALPQIETWFGSAKVLSHQKLLTNAITGDAASGWAWSSQKISLLSENQLYGSKVWGNSKASNGGYEPGEAFKHLNVFNHIDANLLFGNKNIWLRDISSAEWAACLSYGGDASFDVASNAWFAPPALILLS